MVLIDGQELLRRIGDSNESADCTAGNGRVRGDTLPTRLAYNRG